MKILPKILENLPPLEASPTLKSKAELLVYEQKAIEKQQAKLREETAEVWAEFLKENGLDKDVDASQCSLVDLKNPKGRLNYSIRLGKLRFIPFDNEPFVLAVPKDYKGDFPPLIEQMRFVQQNYKPYMKGE